MCILDTSTYISMKCLVRPSNVYHAWSDLVRSSIPRQGGNTSCSLIKPSEALSRKAIQWRAASPRGIVSLPIFARSGGIMYGLVRPSKASSGLGTFADARVQTPAYEHFLNLSDPSEMIC